ncbi:MAG: ribonuclease P protein component [Minisyncoccia bacterium]
MLKKINRADRKTVENIFKKGKFLNSLNLTFKFLKITQEDKKISILVPKSVAKSAVKRNLLRRLGYRAMEKQIKSSPSGIIGVFIFKKYQEDVLVLENEIKDIFSKIN